MVRRVYGGSLTVVFWSKLAASKLALVLGRLPAVCQVVRLALDVESGRSPSGVWIVPRRYEHRVRAALRATYFSPFDDTCLRRCLLLAIVLKAEQPTLRIGVQRNESCASSAHSWLQVRGRALDPTASCFLRLETTAPGA